MRPTAFLNALGFWTLATTLLLATAILAIKLFPPNQPRCAYYGPPPQDTVDGAWTGLGGPVVPGRNEKHGLSINR